MTPTVETLLDQCYYTGSAQEYDSSRKPTRVQNEDRLEALQCYRVRTEEVNLALGGRKSGRAAFWVIVQTYEALHHSEYLESCSDS